VTQNALKELEELRRFKEVAQASEKKRAAEEGARKSERESEQQRIAKAHLDSVSAATQDMERRLAESKREFVDALALAEAARRRLEVDNKAQADELDIARSQLEKLARLEAQLLKAKQKVDEAADARKKLKDAEEQCATYMHRVLDLENEVKVEKQARAEAQQVSG
jgi:hypothetical protein